MFVLYFKPAATGWLVNSARDPDIDDQPTGRPDGKWVHVGARADRSSLPTAPGKEIVGSDGTVAEW